VKLINLRPSSFLTLFAYPLTYLHTLSCTKWPLKPVTHSHPMMMIWWWWPRSLKQLYRRLIRPITANDRRHANYKPVDDVTQWRHCDVAARYWLVTWESLALYKHAGQMDGRLNKHCTGSVTMGHIWITTASADFHLARKAKTIITFSPCYHYYCCRKN